MALCRFIYGAEGAGNDCLNLNFRQNFAWLNDCANGDEADFTFVQTQKTQSHYYPVVDEHYYCIVVPMIVWVCPGFCRCTLTPVQTHRLFRGILVWPLAWRSHKPGRLAWLLPRAVRQVNWPFHCKLKYVIWRTEIQIFCNKIPKFPRLLVLCLFVFLFCFVCFFICLFLFVCFLFVLFCLIQRIMYSYSINFNILQ